MQGEERDPAARSGAIYEDPRAILDRLRSIAGSGGDRGARYEVVEEISRGGMGIILKVRDQEMRRTLAMKRMRADRSADEDPARESSKTARFLEEAQITGQLEHPGIPPIHEVGLDADGQLYFTMQLVKGQTLDEILRKVREAEEGWTLTRALTVVLRVCEAVAFAHERKVIHRDLKPANIMVGRFGETYVMDWGLAKILGAPESHDLRLQPSSTASALSSARKDEASKAESSALVTMDGEIMGTPSYMPPEQARGDLDEIGPRSDVYSVGAILYHLICGGAPYETSGQHRQPVELLQAVTAGPPELIPSASNVPAELIAICERAMQRDPEQRYDSMVALAIDLRAYLEHRVVQAYRTGAGAEFRKWVQRNRPLALALGMTLLLALGSLTTISYVQTQARGALKIANQGLEAADKITRGALARSEQAERLARWQGYIANLSACSASLESGHAYDAGQRLEACEESLRGWEWRFLSNRVDMSVEELRASEESFVYQVAWSPDGSLIASSTGSRGRLGEGENVIRLWNAETLALEDEIVGQEGAIRFLEFSPSGDELVSASKEQALVWDVHTGETLSELSITAPVIFHPDGNHVITAWNNVVLFDISNGNEVFRTPELRARRALFTTDGSGLIVGGWDGSVARYHYPSIRPLWEVDLIHDDRLETDAVVQGVLDLDFLSGNRMVAALDSGDAVVLETSTGEILSTLRGHRRAVTSVSPSPDANRLATSSDDGTIRLWDLSTYDPLDVLFGHRGPVTRVEVSKDGGSLVSSSLDQTLRFWSSEPGASITSFRGTGWIGLEYYGDCDFSQDRVAWCPTSESVCISDARSGLELALLPDSVGTIAGLSFDPDGERLITVARFDRVRTWNAETGALLSISHETLPDLWYVDFDSKAEWFAACTQEKGSYSIEVRSTDTGAVLQSWPIDALAWFVRFTPDGTRLVTGDVQSRLRVYDIESAQILHEVELPGWIHDLACSPTENVVAAVTYDERDNSVYLVDLDTGKQIAVLEGHDKPLVIGYSPDGTRIVTGNFNGTVSLWDPLRGEVAAFPAHDDIVLDVEFSGDGKSLLSFTLGADYRIWHTTSGSMRETPRLHASAERRREPEAMLLIDPLFERLLLQEDVVRELEDSSLSDEMRGTAIRLARLRPITVDLTPGAPVERALVTCSDPDRTPDEYLRALRVAELALQMVHPDDTRAAPCRQLLGAAQYRMGRFQEALATLIESQTLPQEDIPTEDIPTQALFRSMCQARLGQIDAAEATLERAQQHLSQVRAQLSATAEWESLLRLLEEATTVLEKARE